MSKKKIFIAVLLCLCLVLAGCGGDKEDGGGLSIGGPKPVRFAAGEFDPETTTVLDPGIKMLGASSDHLMLDVTDSETEYRVGDVVRLQLGYFSTMRAFTSDYVEKVYLD